MKDELQKRSKNFAIEVIKIVEELPNKRVGWTICDQLVRSSTSVAANYRAVCRAKSDRDFISKIGTVIEEADESLFWMEMIQELDLIKSEEKLAKLMKECDELISIFVTSSKTVKRRLNYKS